MPTAHSECPTILKSELMINKRLLVKIFYLHLMTFFQQ